MKKMTLIITTVALMGTFIPADATGQMTYFATHEDTLYVLREGADNPIASFDLPSGTEGLTYDGEHWWMIKQPEETIYCFDYGGDFVTSFPAPAPYPSALAWDGEYLWISCGSTRDNVTFYQMATDGLPGPYGSFTITGSYGYGLTVFEEYIVAMDGIGLTVFYTKTGTYVRVISLDVGSWDENYSITYDGVALWSSVYEGADIHRIADFDPHTGEWLGHDIDPYSFSYDEGLSAGTWSYTGVEAESFGKIKAFFE